MAALSNATILTMSIRWCRRPIHGRPRRTAPRPSRRSGDRCPLSGASRFPAPRAVIGSSRSLKQRRPHRRGPTKSVTAGDTCQRWCGRRLHSCCRIHGLRQPWNHRHGRHWTAVANYRAEKPMHSAHSGHERDLVQTECPTQCFAAAHGDARAGPIQEC